jgi:nicotinamidase-related amidase
MPHRRILNIERSALLVVDVQEAFRGVMNGFPEMASRISTAVRGFDVLGRAIFVTEQYPKGLGRTVEEILLALPDAAVILEKTAFSSCGAEGFAEQLKSAGVEQVAICGLETHICVNQTAHDLLDRGFAVHVLTDCVASRFDTDKAAGLAKMQGSGAVPSTVEMALFEMLGGSKHPKFKDIQALIK